MGEDFNNSSLNNLFGNFINITEEDNAQYDLNNDVNMVCIDTSNHRIGINTIDPHCSLDISGTNGKIFVNSISCENIDIQNSLKFNGNTNFSGIIDLSGIQAILRDSNNIDNDNIPTNTLYYDISGYVRIKLQN